jgi:hypothetical protein
MAKGASSIAAQIAAMASMTGPFSIPMQSGGQLVAVLDESDVFNQGKASLRSIAEEARAMGLQVVVCDPLSTRARLLDEIYPEPVGRRAIEFQLVQHDAHIHAWRDETARRQYRAEREAETQRTRYLADAAEAKRARKNAKRLAAHGRR